MRGFEFNNCVWFWFSECIEKSITSKGITQFPASELSVLLKSWIFTKDSLLFQEQCQGSLTLRVDLTAEDQLRIFEIRTCEGRILCHYHELKHQPFEMVIAIAIAIAGLYSEIENEMFSFLLS
jgi:hypothetical protein